MVFYYVLVHPTAETILFVDGSTYYTKTKHEFVIRESAQSLVMLVCEKVQISGIKEPRAERQRQTE